MTDRELARRLIPQVEFEVEEVSVVVLQEGPRRANLDQAELQRILNEHLQFNVALVGQGKLLTAGAILDPGAGPRVTGLGFSRLSLDELSRTIAEDPSVRAEVESFRVARYMFPKGSLTFASQEAR
ncbi:MAG TPA: hypothetical protein VF137_00950 [Candidatus Dormibacteraeota bacterium]